ncbi:MAG: EAL domain-containing protein [Hydrogenophaga sp.]|nr:EAL domain-containing protein [Hydrogenophaga sp.]
MPPRSWATPFQAALEKLLRALSIYVIPLVIGLVTVLAMVFWHSQYEADRPQTLGMRVLPVSDAGQTPEAAAAALRSQPLVQFHDTRLSEAPVWFQFEVPSVLAAPSAIEFPSRHAVSLACWDATRLTPLGSASRAEAAAVGVLSPVKAGFGLQSVAAGDKLLCSGSFVGPARLQVALWPAAQLDATVFEFHRNMGLLEGGLVVLAVFVLMTALINRQGIYVLFAAWLVVTLRVGAISAGWDVQWLGRTVPEQWLTPSRAVTLAAYAFVTLTLYNNLFRDDLERSRFGPWLRLAQWLTLPLLVGSVTLPYRVYLPITWVFTSVGLVLMCASLVRIVFKTRSRVAMWYGASLGLTFLSSLSEIVAAAYGMKALVGTVNHVTAALSSSLLAALAIAEQMRQEHEQRLAAQAELQHTYDAMPLALFTLDPQGHFVAANPALRQLLGPVTLDDGDAPPSTWREMFGDAAWLQLYKMVSAGRETEAEFGTSLRTSEGVRRLLVRATLARERIEGSLQDVTEKAQANEHLQFLAHNDPLTKVLNRRGIELELNKAMASLQQGEPMAVAYLDLDRFKLINDLFGHSAGDEVLQQVCARVSNVLSGAMRVGRVGGDEFVIVFPSVRISLATLICRGIIDGIGGAAYHVGERAFHVRGSIGLIEVMPGSSVKDVVSTADRACREAKGGHHQGLVVFEKDSRGFREHETELKLVERLSSDQQIEGMYIEMQPIMSLSTPMESLNFEVLLRMRDPDGAMVPTDRLITAGENSGRMGMIDRWVLNQVVQWLQRHRAQLPRTQFVCLNLSGASLNDESFMEDVYRLLQKNLDIAGWLCLEITESVALHDLENTRRFIDTVRSYGAKVALDDFGAGYTSFSYLKDLPADLLKIDGSFIVNMNRHPANVAIVEAVVNLARNLGMKTIAEWAEDMETVQTLVEIGVDYVQGFAISRSQPAEALLQGLSSAGFIRDPALSSYVQNLQPHVFEVGAADLGVAPAIDHLH